MQPNFSKKYNMYDKLTIMIQMFKLGYAINEPQTKNVIVVRV